MADKEEKELGRLGEEQAANFLIGQGYEMMARNYRYKRGEIDLIVRKQDCLVFVEVKTRTNTDFGTPETFVSPRQQQVIINTADEFIFQRNWQQSIRFDIIAIVPDGELKHFEDAFY